jgi:transcriptional regulator with XRE-family HTH domain
MRSIPIEQLDRLVGRNLRVLRIRARLSQSALGKAIGVTFQQIQKYERGANRISAVRLFLVAQTLRVSITAFFEEH